ncbi:MAG: thermonuclease family protein [Mariprofundaceae bacterium]
MRLLRLSTLLLTLLSAGLSFNQITWAGTFSQLSSNRWVTVSKVYDGDTFKTRSGEKVRLLGINTPEIAHGGKPGQPFGKIAKHELKSLIQGKLVRLQFDREKRDKYGRLLAHIYLRDGTWINAHMIERGLAHSYTFAPNFRHSSELLKKERTARNSKPGIWNNPRFKLLKASRAGEKHIGQFRVVSGKIVSIEKKKWGFKLGKLSITVPKAHRKWFKTPPELKLNTLVTVHGKIRISSRGKLYLALHSPYDLEIMKP